MNRAQYRVILAAVWRNGVIKRFSVSRVRKMNIGVHRSGIVGGEGDTIVMHGVDVVEDIQCGFHVTQRQLIFVRGQEGVGRSNVRACRRQQPTDAADETLISILLPDLHRRVISIGRWRNGINWNSQSIRCGRWSLNAGLAGKALDKVHGKTRLVEMDVN